MRLTQKDLEERVKFLLGLTDAELKVCKLNGIYHVYAEEKKCGGADLLMSGSLRQCYDYIVAFLHSVRFIQSGRF